jgi:hypothetical protein
MVPFLFHPSVGYKGIIGCGYSRADPLTLYHTKYPDGVDSFRSFELKAWENLTRGFFVALDRVLSIERNYPINLTQPSW